MKQSDFAAFQQGMAGVYSFYNRTIDNFSLQIWWKALSGFDLATVQEAFSRHLMNPDSGQYLPKPADIMKMLGGTTQDAALIAWTKVDKAVRTVGTYRTVVFDDPIIHRVIHDMGGWITMGQKTEDEWPFVAKEFETRYRGMAVKGITEYPRALTGIADAENRQQGYRPDQVTLIGDAEQCNRVLSKGSDLVKIGLHQIQLEVMP